MDITEVVAFQTGLDDSGVNFLDPRDAFEVLEDGYVYRQSLRSRKGFVKFGNQLSDGSRVMGIFEYVDPQDSTRTTLACSKEFLYRYSGTTNTWVQIPNTNNAPGGGFSITSNADYVSGTTYPDSAGNGRFIFCSRGMSDIYWWDPVADEVKSFTLDTSAPALGTPGNEYTAPTIGTLTRATYVEWFGDRLNFFKPIVTAREYPQTIVYSGLQPDGNGDKFNAVGSGFVTADTFEIMKGENIISNYAVINFQRSNWTLQTTADKFNPYFFRKIPSVLGTDASFSAVAWSNEVKSLGKTGMITTDGRQSLRFDDKLPYFTTETIDQDNFDLTYGGFDRINEQILYSYLQNGSNLDETTQNKILVYNYKEGSFSIYNGYFSVFGQSNAGQSLAWNEILYSDEHPTWGRMDTTEEIMNEIGISAGYQKTLAGDNDGFIYQINQGFDDYFAAVSDITQASQGVATVATSAFQAGDRVIFENVEGMTEINGIVMDVISATPTEVTLDYKTSNLSMYTMGGTLSKVISFNAKMNPFNPYRPQGRRVQVSHIEVLLTRESPDLYVDFFMDEEEAPFKTVLLSANSATTKNREWITAIVNNEANFITLRFRSEAFNNQVAISSIRIHSQPGGLLSG